PIHQAIIDGETQTGISIMYMAKKLDAGNIIAQKAIDIEPQDDVGVMHDKLSFLGAELLKETLPSIINGTNESIVQNEDEATFESKIRREDEQIDWSEGDVVVYKDIRGVSRWPVAFRMMDRGSLQ